ncbi:hypothetical protein WEI85_35635 [Actinomycetes bacterium KLBMP 9797]
MLTPRRWAAVALTAATLLGTAVAWTARGEDATAAAVPRPPAPDRTVTLLTGDRITVRGDGRRVAVDRAPGRERATFLTRWERGALHVVPTDAAPLLGSGRLDPRLFDVTRLLRAGDDAALVVEGDTRRVRPERRAALWRDLAGGRVASVRLAEAATTEEPPDAETYELTLRLVDRAGRPAAFNTTFVTGLDVAAREALYDVAGTATVRLPRGTYQLGTFIADDTADRLAGTMLVWPELALSGPRTVVLDARLGRPVSITVPEPGAVPVQAVVGFSGTAPDGQSVGGDLVAGGPDGLYTAQLGPRVDGFTSLISAGFRANAEGASRYAYHLAYYQRGGMWTGLDRHPTRAELATVRLHHAQTVTGSTGSFVVANELPGTPWGWRWSQLGVSGALPGVGTAYYNTEAGVHWEIAGSEDLPGDPDPMTVQWHGAAPLAYRSGRTYDEYWNRAVFAPVFPPRPDPVLWVTRTGDRMLVWPSWYGDAAGRDGYSDPAHSAIRLHRDGELVGEVLDFSFGEFPVPAEPGRYRLEISATRGKPHQLSTEISTAWTFDSGHVEGDAPVALPLSAVRFTPALDDRNAAPGGTPYPVPVVVSPQPGSAAGALAELAMEVSYDDGATWRPAEVRRGVALLRHPAGPGYVSLRATATDRGGNRVTQTVVRAYRLRAS